ncbi:MAG: DUF2188 domain-containing protein [Gemmatimonadetes bacterium]|uniref:DUF2188 domain-containing protein n=1 Tax=Candidatus Kutchimonas denitrificans TaxID=3056748 RepID=A0AAE5CDI0_9BACT|nr:DUF2188 domain-containing protein [Gemmatimonadota bacterium]NIR75824.1 DUF2188 domain-containing protein [Candidatus Kutchimonas denitrificans]NIS01992.1 DUF2188 domain-containing protein [Gemmatimonadota bacterium]NIT67796.1 DUF2188 domain-containing protein [Gemmatimonadota bacterium]NIU53783.1 DUF2188 domain-containing protein [Gemmatimonadota bacterium]
MPAKKKKARPSRRKTSGRRRTTKKTAKRRGAKKGSVYTVQTLKGDWVVKKQGKKTPEGKFATKPKAVVAGTRLAKRAKGTLKIKSKTGKIQATRNFAA